MKKYFNKSIIISGLSLLISGILIKVSPYKLEYIDLPNFEEIPSDINIEGYSKDLIVEMRQFKYNGNTVPKEIFKRNPRLYLYDRIDKEQLEDYHIYALPGYYLKIFVDGEILTIIKEKKGEGSGKYYV